MNAGKPLIGVTPGLDNTKDSLFIQNAYIASVIKAGGLPVLLPLTMDEKLADIIAGSFDGFLISGGPDVDARLYGEDNLPFNGEISPLRDYLETFIIKEAVRRNKPVLGICRGMQIMNTALGGTLYQDIHSQLPHRMLLKHSQNAPKWYPVHEIVLTGGSVASESFASLRADVNSFHHQAVKDPAPGFNITSRASDGIIESIEYSDHRYAVGVQWHPELMWQENPVYLKIFEKFVDSCRIV